MLLNACYDVPGGPHDGGVKLIRMLLQLGANPNKGTGRETGNKTPVSVIVKRIDLVNTQILYFTGYIAAISARKRALEGRLCEINMTTPSDRDMRYAKRRSRVRVRKWIDRAKHTAMRVRREIRKLNKEEVKLTEILRVLYYAGAELEDPNLPLDDLSRHPYLTTVNFKYKNWPKDKARLPTARQFRHATLNGIRCDCAFCYSHPS
jgi:hypothetical protein